MSSFEIVISFLPESLILLIGRLIVEVDKKLRIASVGKAIMQGTRPRVLIAPLQLGLAALMHHHFDLLHRHGFCSSYSENKMIKRNAVVTSGTDLNIPDGDCLVQYAANKADHNITSSFHGMGIIAKITPRNTHSQTHSVISRRKTLPHKKLQILAKLTSINISLLEIAPDLCMKI